MRTSPLKFDLDGLRRAIESGDACYLSALYADGAEVRIVDADHPADAPQILHGRPAIASWIASMYAPDDVHRVLESTADAEQVSLVEERETVDGLRLVYAYSAALDRGQITHETGVLMAQEPIPIMIDQSPSSTPHLAPHAVSPGTAVGRHVPGYYLG